jgi:predicted acetyltransferase
MYVGYARNLQEIDAALLLATQSFHEENIETARATKKVLVSPYNSLTLRDVIVLVKASNEVCGACFLIDRIFYRGKRKLKGTFLSSICIAESSRGEGLSKPLMNASIHACEARGSVFAIVIARKKVDHFYKQFFFWGLSQYNTITIKLPEDVSASDHYQQALGDDLSAVNDIYEARYAHLYGACARSTQYWEHILWKAEQQKFQFVVHKTQGKINGYVIYSGNHLYEFATAPHVSSVDLLKVLGKKNNLNEMMLFASKAHPIVNEIVEFDFSISQRQCNFGGHMVRVIQKDVLVACIIDELKEQCAHVDKTQHIEKHGDALIDIQQDKINVTLNGSPYSYQNTSFLMGSETLSTVTTHRPSIYKPNAFNILLMDQV